MRKPTLTILALAFSGFAFPVGAANDHNDVFSCYAYVHEQCFPGGNDGGCGQDVYEDGLDECDGYYEKSGKRPTPPASFSVRPNPQLKTRIMNSFQIKQ